MIDSKVVEQL